MLIRIEVPENKEYVVEIESRRTFKDISLILQKGAGIDPKDYFFTLPNSLESIRPEKTISDIGIEDGGLIVFNYTQEALDSQAKAKLLVLRKNKENRKLLPPKTTSIMNTITRSDSEGQISSVKAVQNDPKCFPELVKRLEELGVASNIAEKALRENNYDYKEAFIAISESKDELLNGFSTKEREFLTRMIDEYGDASMVISAFTNCEKNEQLTIKFLSE